jgi:hypothetical protein
MLILHHHIYKNAGTSFAKCLKNSFGSNWRRLEISKDPDLDKEASLDTAFEHLLKLPFETKAVSSHTLPVFKEKYLGSKRIVPVIFVRDPLDRILSVYFFERNLALPLESAKQAKSLGLRDYILWRLEFDGMFRNYQTNFIGEVPVGAILGTPERFMETCNRVAKQVPEFKPLDFWLNAAQGLPGIRWSLENRLRLLTAEIGATLFNELLQINKEDRELYRMVSKISRNGSL